MGSRSFELDVRGLPCPLPVLKARKQLESMAVGDVLVVTTTDPVSRIDMPHFCREAGHRLLDTCPEGDCLIFRIEKAGGPA